MGTNLRSAREVRCPAWLVNLYAPIVVVAWDRGNVVWLVYIQERFTARSLSMRKVPAPGVESVPVSSRATRTTYGACYNFRVIQLLLFRRTPNRHPIASNRGVRNVILRATYARKLTTEED